MNLHPVLKCFIMECIDATKGIFNTLSLRHDRACSYLLTTVIEFRFTNKVTKGWGCGTPAMSLKSRCIINILLGFYLIYMLYIQKRRHKRLAVADIVQIFTEAEIINL